MIYSSRQKSASWVAFEVCPYIGIERNKIDLQVVFDYNKGNLLSSYSSLPPDPQLSLLSPIDQLYTFFSILILMMKSRTINSTSCLQMWVDHSSNSLDQSKNLVGSVPPDPPPSIPAPQMTHSLVDTICSYIPTHACQQPSQPKMYFQRYMCRHM